MTPMILFLKLALSGTRVLSTQRQEGHMPLISKCYYTHLVTFYEDDMLPSFLKSLIL
jgi:hypothetical protein